MFVTEFSPFEWSSSLVALGLANSILIGQIRLPEEDDTCKEVEFKRVKEIHQDGRVQALAWSPRSSLVVAPKCLCFATAGPDHKLRIFNSDLEQVSMRILKGHTDYINSIAYEPDKGELVLSCSDDQTGKLWDLETGETLHTFHLSSPGMAVLWHPQEMGKILIAQKSGLISLFNSSTYAPIISLDCCSSPLMSADWCLSNSLLLAAAVASDVVYFDLSRPSLPTERRSLHGDGARLVRFSRGQDTLAASLGKPAACLKVSQHRAGQTLITAHKKIIGGGLSWHLRLPYLAVGNDREVDLYRLHQ